MPSVDEIRRNHALQLEKIDAKFDIARFDARIGRKIGAGTCSANDDANLADAILMSDGCGGHVSQADSTILDFLNQRVFCKKVRTKVQENVLRRFLKDSKKFFQKKGFRTGRKGEKTEKCRVVAVYGSRLICRTGFGNRLQESMLRWNEGMRFWQLLKILCLHVLVKNGNTAKDDHNGTLVFVHTVWRHGLMTPEYDFKHPWLNSLRAPLPEGLIQVFNLGQALRKRYVEQQPFLDPHQAYEEIYIRSIDYNRSIEGASAKLAGMLPIKEPMLEKLRGWPSRWMPMPIHMVSLDEDINLNMAVNCPKYQDFFNTMNLIPAYNKTLEANQDLLDYLSRKLNMTVTRGIIGLVWAALQPGLVPAADIPSWVNNTLRDRMLEVAKLEEHYKLIDLEMIRIRGGPMITEIFKRMEAKWGDGSDNKTSDLHRLKYYGYSCRGMPILWELASMGIHDYTNDEIPAYASGLVYELWNRSGLPYVSVEYYNGATGTFKPIQVRLCPKVPAMCPLELFKKSVAPYFIDPIEWWYDDCGWPRSPDVVEAALSQSLGGRNRSLAIGFAIIIILLTLLIVVQIGVLMRPRRRPVLGYENLAERTMLASSGSR